MNRTMKYRLLAAAMTLTLLLTGCGEQGISAGASEAAEAQTGQPSATKAPVVETPQTTAAPAEQTGYGYVAECSALSLKEGTAERLLLAGDTVYLDVVDEEGSHCVMTADTLEPVTPDLDGQTLALCPEGDGFLLCVKTDEGLELLSVGADGTKGETVSLSDSQNRYPTGMALDGEGYAYLMLSDQVLVYNRSGKRVSALTLSGGQIASSIVATQQGQVILNLWSILEDGSREGAVVLLNTESIGASLTEKRIAYQAYAGLGGQVLLSGGGNLYTMDPEQETMEPILGWIETAVNPDEVISVQQVSEDSIWFLSRTETGTELGVLSRVSASEIPERTTVSVGVGEITQELRQLLNQRAAQFNQDSQELRVRLVDYSVYESGDQRLQDDAGDLDLVIGSPETLGEMSLLPIEPLLDETVGKDTLLPGVWSAISGYGEPCWLPVYFTVETLIGNSALVGEEQGWTPEEFSSVLQENSDKAVLRFSNCYDVLDTILSVADLDGESMAPILEAAARIPAEDSAIYELEANGDGTAAEALQNKTLLLEEVELKSFMELKALETAVGEALVLKGYPGESGNGAYLRMPVAVGIPSESSKSQEAWSFLKVILCGNEDVLSQQTLGFPVMEADFTAMAEEAMEKVSFLDDSGALVEQNPVIWLDGEPVETEPFTSDEIDAFREYLSGSSGVAGRSQSLRQAARNALKEILENGKTPAEAAESIYDN